MMYPSYIENVISRLQSNGAKAYAVGGCVRDSLLGISPSDFDVATSASPDKTAEIFADRRVILTGAKHGTVTVLFNEGQVEITTFRIDGEYVDSRHPDSVSFTDDVSLDLCRRDFTVNAMAYNKDEGLIDLFGGRTDLEKGIIRTVGDAAQRFSEDALRILRAFRFVSQLDFDISDDTLFAAYSCAPLLSCVSPERIFAELSKLVCGAHPEKALALIRDSDIFKYITPSHVPSDVIIQSIGNAEDDLCCRLALLLSEASGDTVQSVLSYLRVSNKVRTAITALIRGANARVASPEDARRLIANTGIWAQKGASLSELIKNSPRGAEALVASQANTPKSIKDLKIGGGDLLALGITGKNVGKVLNTLFERTIITPALNDRQTLIRLAAEIYKAKE